MASLDFSIGAAGGGHVEIGCGEGSGCTVKSLDDGDRSGYMTKSLGCTAKSLDVWWRVWVCGEESGLYGGGSGCSVKSIGAQ